jgi:preprotein translocase subunit YajC
MPLFLLLHLAPAAAPVAQQLNPIQKALGPLAGSPIMPLLLIFGVFYLLIMRPQQQKQREHEAAQKRIAQGDEVITTGGLVGKVTHATDEMLTVEVGEKVRVRVLRSHASLRPKPAEKSDKDKDKASA